MLNPTWQKPAQMSIRLELCAAVFSFLAWAQVIWCLRSIPGGRKIFGICVQRIGIQAFKEFWKGNAMTIKGQNSHQQSDFK